MFLSQLRLNPANSAARRDLADAYQMHRTLSRVYADGVDTRPSRFLWRLERAGPVGEPGALLVQSSSLGNWRALDDLQGYLASIYADKRMDVEKWVVPGRGYRFRLAANPTVTREGKRLGLLKEADQLAWLSRQAQRGGFTVIGAACSACDRIDVPYGGKGSRITVTRVQFDGELVAREPVALQRTLQLGVGHAKALGMGLLSLAPA